MRLDDHVFEEVAMALGVEHTQDGELKLRRAHRFRLQGDAVIRPYGVANAISRSVKLADISQIGMGFFDQLNMSPGERFTVTLPRAGGNAVDVLCTVRQCRFSGGAFRIGAEFTGEMEGPDRLLLGSQGVLSGKSDPSQMGRNLNVPAIAYVVSQGPNGPSFEVTVQDIAKGGFTLLSTHAFAAGDRILLKLQNPRIHPCAYWCTLAYVHLAGSGAYRIHARNDGAYVPPRKSGIKGLLGRWFK